MKGTSINMKVKTVLQEVYSLPSAADIFVHTIVSDLSVSKSARSCAQCVRGESKRKSEGGEGGRGGEGE